MRLRFWKKLTPEIPLPIGLQESDRDNYEDALSALERESSRDSTVEEELELGVNEHPGEEAPVPGVEVKSLPIPEVSSEALSVPGASGWTRPSPKIEWAPTGSIREEEKRDLATVAGAGDTFDVPVQAHGGERVTVEALRDTVVIEELQDGGAPSPWGPKVLERWIYWARRGSRANPIPARVEDDINKLEYHVRSRRKAAKDAR